MQIQSRFKTKHTRNDFYWAWTIVSTRYNSSTLTSILTEVITILTYITNDFNCTYSILTYTRNDSYSTMNNINTLGSFSATTRNDFNTRSERFLHTWFNFTYPKRFYLTVLLLLFFVCNILCFHLYTKDIHTILNRNIFNCTTNDFYIPYTMLTYHEQSYHTWNVLYIPYLTLT